MRTLGIDLGTNSVGWCLIETKDEPLRWEDEPGAVVAIGTRIFKDGRDPQSGASLAVDRRAARSQRRRRDRYLRRREALLNMLTEFGLMPADAGERRELVHLTGDKKPRQGGEKRPHRLPDFTDSVYELRARGPREKLSPHHLGRVLFHLDQRRGFKSNRKTDRRDNDQGKIEIGVNRLRAAMGQRTYGQFLFDRRAAGQSVRTRLRPETGEDAKGDGYDFYPSRAALEAEFDAIMDEQAKHYPDLLTGERIAQLRHAIFYQRPLKPVDPGLCSYNYGQGEKRLPKAHPLFQTFRLLKEVNELALVDDRQRSRKLTPEQRDTLVSLLRNKKKIPFKTLRRKLGYDQDFSFNKESETRTDLLGDEVHVSMVDRKAFGPRWADFGIDRQWEILSRLREEEDPLALHEWLVGRFGLEDEQARHIAKLQLPDGYGRLGETALKKLSEALRHEVDADGFVITEAEAARRCGYNHSDKSDPDFPGYPLLPPYQEVLERLIPPGTGDPDNPYDVFKGRITNPSVHIALNQLRKVVNEVIKHHGKPDRIAIELGRDLKLSERQKDEVERRIRKNTREAEARSAELVALGQPDTGYNRLRLKLWQELNKTQPLDRCCVYCGEAIAPHDVFNQSQVDVDHILPYSKTLDDGEGNKILCHTHCNRQKRNRAPADVREWDGRYDDILARANVLPKNKRWRFARDAMERFADEEGFLARQLTDMQYASRLALTYLASLYRTEEADGEGVIRKHSHVRALPGRMTEMLRRKWGLNALLPDHNIVGSDLAKEKNRKDHRHHAIDAFVIACTSRSLIQKLQTAAGAMEDEGTDRVLGDVKDPWPGFREALRCAVNAIVVSHRPDHGTVSRAGYAAGKGQTAGKLHNDTAYGFAKDKDGNDRVVRRRALTDFKSAADLEAIRDGRLRTLLLERTYGLSGRDFEMELIRFAGQDTLNGQPNPFKGLRHVRVLETQLMLVPIKDREGKPYKAYLTGGNYRFDVWELPDGRWDADVISMFEAHQPGYVSRIRQSHHNPRKVISLMIGDMVAYDDPTTGERIIARVRKFDQRNKQIYLDAHNEAGSLDKRHADENDPFRNFSKRPNALKAINIRQVRVDEIGRVFDPGPWWKSR